MTAFLRGLCVWIIALAVSCGSPSAAKEMTVDDLHRLRTATLEARKAAELRLNEEERETNRKLLDYALQPERDMNFHEKVRTHARTSRSACASGDWESCLALGIIYSGQEGAQADLPLAFAILWLGCTAQHYDSCVELSMDIVDYFSYQGSRPEVQVFSAACADGNGSGCYALVQYDSNYQRGRGPLKDDALAKSLIERGCKLNDGFNCDHATKTKAELAQARLTKDKEGCGNDDSRACGNMARRVFETDPVQALDGWVCRHPAH